MWTHLARLGRRGLAATGALPVLLAGLTGAAAGSPAPPTTETTAATTAASTAADGWVTAWGASAMAPSNLVSTVQSLDDQTVRNIVHVSAGGSALRVEVTNAFGDRPLTVATATVAQQLRDASIDPATLYQLGFGGHASVTVRPGGSVLSDPVAIPVPATRELAVSLYVPGPTGPATYHQNAQQVNYLARGDHTADIGAGGFDQTVSTWFLIDAIQVRGAAPGAVVTFGDAATDGTMGQNNANTRWPDFLARRLAARYGAGAPAVVDEGIRGNRLLHASACFGASAEDRMERDVLSQPGARAVIMQIGVDDLGFSQDRNAGCTAPNADVTPAQLIDGYQRVIARAHDRGLRIYGGTIMPAAGFEYWDDGAEVKRLAVNTWIRTSHAFDGVIDFAALVAYPGHPDLLDPRYDSGDHLHLNDAGYEAMADAVDLTTLTRPLLPGRTHGQHAD